MKVIFARHGETDYNMEDRLQGRSETDLNKKGREQAVCLAEFCVAQNVQTIYTSPLQRARQTAAEVNKATGAAVQTDKVLTEICYGEWEGMKRSDLKMLPVWQDREKNPFSFVHPGSFQGINGESYEILYKRLSPFFKSLNDESRIVLVVAHLGVMRSARMFYEKGSPAEFSSTPFPNNVVYIVKNAEGVLTTEFHNLS